MCSGIAGVFEQFDGTFEVVSSFFDAALIAIDTTESELSDCEAGLDVEGFLVVGLGEVGLSERLVGGSESKVNVVGLVGDWFEFERTFVVSDGIGESLECGVDEASVVVSLGVVSVGECQGSVERLPGVLQVACGVVPGSQGQVGVVVAGQDADQVLIAIQFSFCAIGLCRVESGDKPLACGQDGNGQEEGRPLGCVNLPVGQWSRLLRLGSGLDAQSGLSSGFADFPDEPVEVEVEQG